MTYKECSVWGITQVKISSYDWLLRMQSINHVIKTGTFLQTELLTTLVDPATRKNYPCKCLPECDHVSYYLQQAEEGRLSV